MNDGEPGDPGSPISATIAMIATGNRKRKIEMSETTSTTEHHAAMAALTTAALKVADRLDLTVISVWTRGYHEFSVSVQFNGTDTANVDRYGDELGLADREESTNYYRTGTATLGGYTARVQAYCGHPNPKVEES